MNSERSQGVERRVPKAHGVIVIALAGILAGACVQVDGGAVELSWRIRDFAGDNNSCQASGIGQIRICWRPLGDGGSPDATCIIERTDAGLQEQFRTFDCTQNRGVTRFEVPPGQSSLFVRPLCIDGSEPTGPFQVPAPIVRFVEDGRVVTLNQILIVASNRSCTGDACTCGEP